MKRQIRRGVFETNSSSVHSLTMCMKSDYSRWAKDNLFLFTGSGWCYPDDNKPQKNHCYTKEEAIAFHAQDDEKICIVSQTTFNYKKFQDLVEIFQKKGYDIIVANTICNATEERQKEATELASRADVMIVIGGTHSSNTRKLYELCKSECENTYYIQTLADLQLDLPNSVELVGITAGASTPNKIIEEVQNYVRINF